MHTTCLMHMTWAMGWLQLVGSIKLQVSFAEYSLFYRALLQKRPVILAHDLPDAHDLSYLNGVATVSRIDKIIGLFCKRDL